MGGWVGGDVNCTICGDSLQDEPQSNIVDAFKYKQGELAYISLMHRGCAKAKGYKIDRFGHLDGAGPRGEIREAPEPICTGCMGTGIYKHEGDAREYQCPYCKGNGKSPYPVKPINNLVKEEEQTCNVCNGSGRWDRHRPCPVCGGTGVVNESIERKAGQFLVVDKRGKPVGKPYPSYTAAQKADQGRMRGEETNEPVPTNESYRPRRLRTFMEHTKKRRL